MMYNDNYNYDYDYDNCNTDYEDYDYDLADEINDTIANTDMWTSLGGGCRTTAGRNYDE